MHVKAESLDPDALLDALKKGHYYSSQGPQIHELSLSRKELTIACSPVDTIVVLCGHSRTVNRMAAPSPAPPSISRSSKKGWLLTKQSPWLRIFLIDHAGKRAWTNPIWKDEL